MRARHPFRVWALDTTFTGSSAFGNLEAAIKEISPAGPPVALTVTVILPVENNVTKNIHRQKALRLGLRSRDGREAVLKLMKRTAALHSLSIRIYPVAKTLTEDVPPALELSYGRPVNGRPVYVRGLCQDLTIRVTRGRRVAERHLVSGKNPRRRDTAHDWLFNHFEGGRLRRILRELGMPDEPSVAVKELLRSPEHAQYAGGPICIRVSRWDRGSTASLLLSRGLRKVVGAVERIHR